eukprot:scaffold134799_cov21-Tisochrysis_lutea.AAC.1
MMPQNADKLTDFDKHSLVIQPLCVQYIGVTNIGLLFIGVISTGLPFSPTQNLVQCRRLLSGETKNAL